MSFNVYLLLVGDVPSPTHSYPPLNVSASITNCILLYYYETFRKPDGQVSCDVNQSRRQREGAVVPGPPFEIGSPPFHVWPTGCRIHPILHFKNVAPPFGFWPLLLVFGPPAAKSWRRA